MRCPATTVDDPSIWVGQNYMNLADPNPAEIHLTDIARALSRVCRFNGHTDRFLSVAEHSVNCVEAFARWASGDIFTEPHLRDIARDVLMHDASEAYLGDIVSPLKGILPDYRVLEDRMEAAIAERFNLSGSAPEWVKRVDLEMLALEKHALMPDAPDWPCLAGVHLHEDFPVECQPPEVAELDFLLMARDLGIDGWQCSKTQPFLTAANF
ncbi:MAG: hypothetical protein AAGE03_04485 [Pseudomonadota bacterium]